MKQFIFTLLISGFTAAESLGTQLHLQAECSVSGEYVELDPEEITASGWTSTENEYGDTRYTFVADVEVSQLPLSQYLGDLGITVSKTGLMQVDISVGDSDAGAGSSIQLPQKNGELLPLENMEWTISGGDYASGMWSFDCSTKVSITK